MTQREAFTVKRLGKHNAEVEKIIGQEYAYLYGQVKAQLADLYATMGDNVTLEEARKYSRLQNLLATTRKAYEKLTKRTITKTEMLSAYNYSESYFANMWQAEVSEGPFKWKNPEIEAIRASVFWEGTGLSLPKRFGKNVRAELTDIEAAITRGIATGANYKDTAKALENSITGGYNNALRIVRTESTRNRAEGFSAAFDVMSEAGLDVRKVWITRMDGREREDHAALNEAESDKNGMFHTSVGLVAGPGLSGVASFDINCFVGETVPVYADAERLYKRLYSGNVVRVKTALGADFTVTPNHPVLTAHGWVAAGLLNEGHHVVSMRLGKEFLEGENDVKHGPPSFAELFYLAGIVGSFEDSFGGSEEQFHGDGSDGQVDIKLLEGGLLEQFDSPGLNAVAEPLLTKPNVLERLASGDRVLSEMLRLPNHASDSAVSSFREFLSLLGSRLSHAQIHGVATPALDDTCFVEPAHNSGTTDSKFIGKLFDGVPSMVLFDDIVSVDVGPYYGHVYNLQTKSGMYGVYNGKGLVSISHNCRCSTGTTFADEGPKKTQVELAQEWDAWMAKNGSDKYKNL